MTFRRCRTHVQRNQSVLFGPACEQGLVQVFCLDAHEYFFPLHNTKHSMLASTEKKYMKMKGKGNMRFQQGNHYLCDNNMRIS